MAKKKAAQKKLILKSQREVAQFFGVTAKTVQDWVVKGMPGERGNYDLAEIRKWKEARGADGKNKPPEHSTDLRVEKLQAEVRKLKAEAHKAEKANEFIEGQFIDRHLVENFVSQFNQHIRNELLRLPVEMQAAFPAEHRVELQQEMTNRLRLFLESLATWQRRVMELDVTEKLNRAGRPAGT